MKPHHPSRYMAIITHQDNSASAKLARLALSAASKIYHPITAMRNTLYNHGVCKAHSLGRVTISVGNLTAGGTGKTPIVTDITRRLLAMGKKPAVLLRGYHAHQGLSDEAQLLADALSPGASVHMHAKRRIAAANALAKDSSIDCFVLDDAFQHRQASRDLDLVLIDATNPFGHDSILPRGLLRESTRGLARADGVIITRADLITPDELDALTQELERLAKGPILGSTTFVWDGYRDATNDFHPLGHLQGQSVMGVCGVGNPKAFEKMLTTQLGQQLVVAMDDHHVYRHDDLTELFLMATRHNVQAIVTTEKDWVKWRQFTPPIGWPLPVYRPVLGVQWQSGSDALDARLAALFA